MKKFANIFFSTTNFFESSGTVVNYELRAQRFFQVYDVSFYDKNIFSMSSWKVLNLIRSKIFKNKKLIKDLDNLIIDCIRKIPFLKNIKKSAPDSLFRIFGQKIPRSPHRSSGRTALRADINIHEVQQTNDKDTMFSFSMEGSSIYNKKTSCIPFIWSPNWNSGNGWHKYQEEVSGALLAGNPGKFLVSFKKKKLGFFQQNPKPFVKRKGLIIVPYYLLFGSEELSKYSSVIKKKISLPCLRINKLDAKHLNISNNRQVFFTYLKDTYNFFLVYSKSLSVGQIALPIGQNRTSTFLIGKEIQDLREA